MRIIDERGRLFGKINVFDFVVLLFILCVIIPVAGLAWKIFHNPLPIGTADTLRGKPRFHYNLPVTCPNCGHINHETEIPLGTAVEDIPFLAMECPNCKCPIVIVDNKSNPKMGD